MSTEIILEFPRICVGEQEPEPPEVELVESTRACQRVSSYFGVKRAFDVLIASWLLFPVLPLIGFLIVLIRWTSKGPGIYVQERIGKNGRPFLMYKLRSMSIDAEKHTGAVWAAEDDPRVTKLGRILRRFHLDELPQLFNVLRGEMALVGPRPERCKFVERLAVEIEGYCDRLRVLPGITGYAQLNLPPDHCIDDVRRKIALDFEYMENASLSFDCRLILGTVARFFKYRGSWILRRLGVYRDCVP